MLTVAPACSNTSLVNPAVESCFMLYCLNFVYVSRNLTEGSEQEAALPGGKDYTVPKYLQLVQALRRRAAKLGKRGLQPICCRLLNLANRAGRQWFILQLHAR